MSGKKIDVSGGGGLGQNPFGALSASGLPSGPVNAPAPTTSGTAGGKPAVGAGAKVDATKPEKNRGRVDILREKAGRGGKTVTVVCGFTGIGLPEKEALAKKIQRACGVGGTVKDGRIEIQGDNRDVAAKILTEAGFRPVFAGG